MDSDLVEAKPMRKSVALIKVRELVGSHGFVRVTPEGEKQAGVFQNGFECMAVGETWEVIIAKLLIQGQAPEASVIA